MSVIQVCHHIVAVDTAEELLAYNAELEREANARIQSWQWSITKGEYLRYTYDFAPGLVVYAEVLSAKPKHPYVFVRAYSTAVPAGELGDVHRSVLAARIGREEFEAARARGWRTLCSLQT